MPDIRVTHALGAYDVTVRAGVLDEVGSRVRALWPERTVALITDETVRSLLADRLAGGPWTLVLSVPPGEASKSRARWEALTDALSAAGHSRDSAVVALGGGVVGDLAGFVAATYRPRHSRSCRCPTTLLAMLDCVGRRQDRGRHAAGEEPGRRLSPPGGGARRSADPARHAARSRQYRGGLAEAVKHGLIALTPLLGRPGSSPSRRSPPATPRRSHTSSAAASRSRPTVVTAGRTRVGTASVLNAGHTIAHAVEQVSRFCGLARRSGRDRSGRRGPPGGVDRDGGQGPGG